MLDKSQKAVYQVSSVLLVQEGAPGTTYPGGPTGGTSTDSLGQALNYAAEIQSLSVMQYVINYDPQLRKRGYTANDLLLDVVPSTSTTAATITLLASANHPADAVLLANDVANGFAAYITAQAQQELNTKINSLKAQISAAQQQKAYWESKLESLPNNTTPQYAVYNNDVLDATHTIDSLQAQLQVLPATVKGDVFVIQQATPKDVTTSPKGLIIMGVTVGVGLLLGILLMLLLIFLDTRLRNAEQVKEKLGMAYLGSLSNSNEIKEAPTRVRGELLHEVSDICVNLRLTGVLPGAWQAPHGAVLLITSPQVAEGKSSLAAALSVALARGGSRVLVMDGNLQKPSTHLAFKMSGSGPGLSGLLKGTGRENVDDAVMRCNVPGVWLLPAGPAMDDATLLLEQKLPDILKQLRSKADIIIIDGPALLTGADASLLATMADGVALVIDARHERLPLLLRTRDLLNSLTRTPAGLIMNRLARSKRNSYYAIAYPGSGMDDRWVSLHSSVVNISSPAQPGMPLLPVQSSVSSPGSNGGPPAPPAAGMSQFPTLWSAAPLGVVSPPSAFPSNMPPNNATVPSPTPWIWLPGAANEAPPSPPPPSPRPAPHSADMSSPPPSRPKANE